MLTAFAASLLPLVGYTAPPTAVKATYELYRNHFFVAVIQESYTAADGKYRIDSEATTQGLVALVKKDRITRLSTGDVAAGGLKPESFEEKRISGDKDKTASARFDWKDATISLNHDGKTESHPLEAGTQDIASLFYQFLFRAPKTDVVKVTVTDGKRLENYEYRFVDEQSVDTPAGKFTAAHYMHVSENGDRKTEIWLAREKSSFLIRFLQDDKGTVLEQRLVALTFN
jgi:hypothetical protein